MCCFMHFCLMAICCPLDYRSVVACEQERKPYLCHKTFRQYPLCCVRATLEILLNMKHQVIWVFILTFGGRLNMPVWSRTATTEICAIK